MTKFPWENESLSPLTRRELLDRAYTEFVNNPFWQLIQRAARTEARHCKDQTANPQYTNDQLRFAQGQYQAWEQVPGIAVVLYESEDAELERLQREDDAEKMSEAERAG